MQTNNIFTKLGLPVRSALIYQALLENGPSTIASIAKTTGLHRPVVYNHLPLLIEKSLVSQTKINRRALYSAENPNTLENLVQELQSELQDVMPALQQEYERVGCQPTIRYFQGKNGISYVYDRLLRSAEKTKDNIIYRYESPSDYAKNKKYYPRLYLERATGGGSQRKIQKFVITNQQTLNRRHKNINRYDKAVPESFDKFTYDITQLIMGDKVAFIDYDTETASLIESKTFANFQRQIFKLLFQKLND